MDFRAEQRLVYVGVVDGSDGVWGVRIPDLPGCHGAGGNRDEAIADAGKAAAEWIAHQRAAGVAIPDPRDADAVLADPRSEYDGAREEAVSIAVG